MFARFDENPAMTLRVIKETKRYGRTDGRMDARTDGQRENSIPLQTKFARGIIKHEHSCRSSIYYISDVNFVLFCRGVKYFTGDDISF